MMITFFKECVRLDKLVENPASVSQCTIFYLKEISTFPRIAYTEEMSAGETYHWNLSSKIQMHMKWREIQYTQNENTTHSMANG